MIVLFEKDGRALVEFPNLRGRTNTVGVTGPIRALIPFSTTVRAKHMEESRLFGESTKRNALNFKKMMAEQR